jgi:hypothetical protein
MSHIRYVLLTIFARLIELHEMTGMVNKIDPATVSSHAATDFQSAPRVEIKYSGWLQYKKPLFG